jgi:hypothetical protein
MIDSHAQAQLSNFTVRIQWRDIVSPELATSSSYSHSIIPIVCHCTAGPVLRGD